MKRYFYVVARCESYTISAFFHTHKGEYLNFKYATDCLKEKLHTAEAFLVANVIEMSKKDWETAKKDWEIVGEVQFDK